MRSHQDHIVSTLPIVVRGGSLKQKTDSGREELTGITLRTSTRFGGRGVDSLLRLSDRRGRIVRHDDGCVGDERCLRERGRESQRVWYKEQEIQLAFAYVRLAAAQSLDHAEV